MLTSAKFPVPSTRRVLKVGAEKPRSLLSTPSSCSGDVSLRGSFSAVGGSWTGAAEGLEEEAKGSSKVVKTSKSYESEGMSTTLSLM